MLFPLIIIIFGLVFLLKNLGLIGNHVWAVIWPCLIIVLGLSILLKRKRRRERWDKFEEDMHKFGKGVRETFGGEEK